MKKLLLGAILLFSVMSCSTDETTESKPNDSITIVGNNAYFNKELLDIKPNKTKSFIVEGYVSHKVHWESYIQEKLVDGTFKYANEQNWIDDYTAQKGNGVVNYLLVGIKDNGKISLWMSWFEPNKTLESDRFKGWAIWGGEYVDMDANIEIIDNHTFRVNIPKQISYYDYGSKTSINQTVKTYFEYSY